MNEVQEFCPTTPSDWREWLEQHHQEKDAVWLIFYRKKSPNYNLSWSESVDQAICFGWIDSTKKTIDHESYKQYFTKRKPKSNWSKVNKEKVDTLIAQGLMREAGYKSIEVAKENGSWTILDSVEELIIPEELEAAFADHKGSMEFYNSLSNSVKKMFLYWVNSAKRTETRQKRSIEIALNASKNQKPERFR